MENSTQYQNITSYSRIEPIRPVNEEFTLCKVYVQGVGKNRNYSYMSRKNILRAEPTLHYIPVVGHLLTKYDEDGNEVGKYFGGHDYVLDENWEYKAQTVPFGVVTADPTEFEEVEEYDQTVTYLTATAILWTGRYPELKEAVYADDCWFAQSMEIAVTQSRPYEEDSNFTELLDWTYSALCILGKSDDPDFNTEPCFISSRFVPLSYSQERESFHTAMSEMREHLAFILSPKKGGEAQMDQEMIASVLAEFGLTADAIDFSTEGMDEEALRSAAKAFAEAQKPGEPGGEEQTFVCEFVATYNQRRDALRNALDSVVVRDPQGNVVSATHYWVNDFDDAHVFVERYIYTANGDDNTDHGRFNYVMNEADNTASITSDFELMHLMWLTTAEKNELDAARNAAAELTELRAYKAQAESDKRAAEVEDLFAQFEDLAQVDGYAALRESALESGSLEEIETKLYALRGRQVKSFAKGSDPKRAPVKVGISGETPNDDPYGGLMTKYN